MYLILPCFPHSVERADFLVDEPAAFLESTFGHEYMAMWIVAHTLGKWVQHHDSTSRQSSISVLLGNCVVDRCNCRVHQNLV